MKTTELNGKKYTLNEQGDGSIVLTPEVEEVATPQAGEVWEWGKGARRDVFLWSDAGWICPWSGYTCGNGVPDPDRATRLGTFDEVYVRRDEVERELKDKIIEALKIQDADGDSVWGCHVEGGIVPYMNTTEESVKKIINLVTN